MVFEDIDSLCDATLVITNTSGDQITARRIRTKERTLTLLGCQSDATQQVISTNHRTMVEKLQPQPTEHQERSAAADKSNNFHGHGRTIIMS
jgi:predicted ATP-grasp superfamily ATP-dependent carboligase